MEDNIRELLIREFMKYVLHCPTCVHKKNDSAIVNKSCQDCVNGSIERIENANP